MNAKLTHTIRCIAALVVMAAFALPSMAAQAQISATLEPSNVAVGEPAQLTVTVTGDSSDEPALPHVDGLDFAPMGQSSELESINGAVTASSSHSYVVTANRPGNFTIPPLKIGQGSSVQTTQSFVLQVTGSASAAAPNANVPSAPALPSPNVAGADDDQTVSNNGQQAFLRLVTPRHKLHVGELVPVQIKAYFLDGMQASINGLPSLSSDAFTLNSLDDKPAQTQEDIDGQSYTVLTWTTALSAVKAGDYSLSLELPVQLTVRENARRHRSSDDPFDDNSFFDDFFGNTVQKQVTLRSQAQAQSVLPLPLANRPDDFSGALGQFTIAAEASPNHVNAGDPITLRLTVTGQGNFDRVSSGLPNNSADWKSYKPVARFAPADSVGLEGTKTFEQAVVPVQAGHLNIPALSFSYFDPETARYVTRTTAPIAIDVAPVANQSAAISAPPSIAQANGADQPEFSPNRVEPGSFTPTLRPLFLQSWFVGANVLALATLAAIHFFVRRRALRDRDPQAIRARLAERAIHDQLVAMDSAMQHAQTSAFFASARRALQQRLGERWNLPPETITLTEINARLNGVADGIRPVFQMADQVAYSHENLPSDDLAGWKRVVTEELRELETI